MDSCGHWDKWEVAGWEWVGEPSEEMWAGKYLSEDIRIPEYEPIEPQLPGQELPPLAGPDNEAFRMVGFRP